MKRATKIWLICAVALVLLGTVIFAGAMSMLNWNFLRLSNNKCETNEYEINDAFSNISVKADTADIVFLQSNDEKTHVICREYKNENHSVKVTDNTLTIELTDTRKWYEHISFILLETPSIKIYLPEENYKLLDIKSSTGDIEIPDFLKLESVNADLSTGDINLLASSDFAGLKTDTGNINVENITVGKLEIVVSTGDITVKNTTCEGYISINATTGDVSVCDTRCHSLASKGTTGYITLKNTIAKSLFSIERDTGDVELEKCDAEEILIVTDTGHVHGTLLSDKVFITSSDTGKIRVPESTTGGKCKITTDTGDIKITVKALH